VRGKEASRITIVVGIERRSTANCRCNVSRRAESPEYSASARPRYAAHANLFGRALLFWNRQDRLHGIGVGQAGNLRRSQLARKDQDFVEQAAKTRLVPIAPNPPLTGERSGKTR
jgi:hypothetical protein